MVYDYIVNEKGISPRFTSMPNGESLRCKRRQLVEGYEYSLDELKQLEQEYDLSSMNFTRSKLTANIMLEFAELEALYINDLDQSHQPAPTK